MVHCRCKCHSAHPALFLRPSGPQEGLTIATEPLRVTEKNHSKCSSATECRSEATKNGAFPIVSSPFVSFLCHHASLDTVRAEIIPVCVVVVVKWSMVVRLIDVAVVTARARSGMDTGHHSASTCIASSHPVEALRSAARRSRAVVGLYVQAREFVQCVECTDRLVNKPREGVRLSHCAGNRRRGPVPGPNCSSMIDPFKDRPIQGSTHTGIEDR
jgi:hypothetical protein